MIYRISRPDRRLVGAIDLAGSKSISNRALLIRALCEQPFPIERLANANDTRLLQELLNSETEERNAGPAGTTFRFLTAYFALQPGVQILTGTQRMKQRPIGLLVEALRTLGARIEYLEREGYPPLRIGEATTMGRTDRLAIPADTSSQYISALLMIAPVLPGGLTLELEGEIVSRPYIEMTLNLMRYFGVDHSWEGPHIRVPPQAYQARPFTVEADWSAASYYYAMAAFGETVDLQLNGLFSESVQGDAILTEMTARFGLRSTFNEQGVRLTRTGEPAQLFERDFLRCPDLAQTLAVICGGLGVRGVFSGLKTLRIKETDRIDALQKELMKVQVFFSELPPRLAGRSDKKFYLLEGKADLRYPPRFATYEDHRMAMAFAPLALLGPVEIEDPMVVVKSYPDFWDDLQKLGFVVAQQ